MPRGQELGVHLGTTHRGEQALALRNAESTFPQTQVLALRNAHSKAGRTSARFTKPRDTAFANSSDGDCHVTIILSANIYWGAGLQPFCYATEVVQRIIEMLYTNYRTA